MEIDWRAGKPANTSKYLNTLTPAYTFSSSSLEHYVQSRLDIPEHTGTNILRKIQSLNVQCIPKDLVCTRLTRH